MVAIDLDGVTKTYGGVTALQGVDLTVESGEVFGFLGPNGAGKSTTIDILLDHARPTTGHVTVLGMDAQTETVAVRERIGVLPERFGPLGEMTGRQQLEFAIEAKSAEDDPDAIMERVGIAHAADRPTKGYSKGMTQRLMLGMALVDDPDLLILDEPTTGLDPNGARQLRQIVHEEADRGATVFFSSHILEQVEAVCDRVGILDQGNLVAVDSIDGLRDAAGTTGEMTLELDSVPDNLDAEIERIEGVASVRREDGSVTVGCENPAKGAIVRACQDAGATVENIETSEASLEDLFAAYTGGA
ncbi:ABC transporter ATP-binding protein [Halorhabdus sp. CBA1104]|uniref:ABC transporter ATP-binding protein n=1 Tax=Halorhabdus sp. CBA1104 TaxID=1380432 RepID=UPI0012B2C9A2|nr:ABC transporter ATP-binding protein [Halorhabdus sp. CBA1104]QGN07318.1 ABC transporter ATP-binding protein [Halorhabdus sp. CBA1104]